MKQFCSKYLQLVLVLVVLCGTAAFCQAPAIQTTVDSNGILIGNQFHLKVAVNFPGDQYTVNWLSIPDSIRHFEVIEKGKADSTFTNNQLTGITQVLTLTSFDSGKWNLPVFKVNFAPVATGPLVSLYSDSLPITVSFSTADTTTQLKDIKPVYEVEVPFPLWYWVAGIAGLLLLTGLIFAGWRYFKKKPKKQLPVSKLSAYATAIKALEALEGFNLEDPPRVKIFHTKTVDIFRQYLSGISGINQQNKSTSDLLIVLNGYGIDKDAIAKAATSLRCSDAVKFAKYLPDTTASREAMQSVKETIEMLNKKITAADNQGSLKK